MGSARLTIQRLLQMVLMAASPPSPSWSCPFFSNKIAYQRLPTNYQQVTAYMGSQQVQNKPKILCLHGYRTSASILQKQIVGRWPQIVIEKLDLDFLDGPFPARGKSDVEGFYDPPYYEWYHSSEDFRGYTNFDECIAYIEEYMVNHGPFDGLLGFSQGAIISAAVPGMQAQGVAFTRVPKIKFLMLISGAKFGGYHYGQPKLAANAFSSSIDCPSLHVIGEMDFLKAGGTTLLESFVDPVVLYHPKGHIVPRLEDKGLHATLKFIEKIQKMLSLDKQICLGDQSSYICSIAWQNGPTDLRITMCHLIYT